jgi:hypothetical protein
MVFTAVRARRAGPIRARTPSKGTRPRARSARVMLTGLMLAGAATAAAGGAEASSSGFFATLGGSVSSVSSFNSAGGANTVTILGTGRFQVVLHGLGNALNSNVQVNAYNTNGHPHVCTSQGWTSSNGVDVTAYVGCYDFAGNPYSADFSLFYQSRSAATGGWAGFVWADQPTAASYTPNSNYNYNNRGGVNTVTRQSAGVYTVTFPSLRAGGNPQVTAYSGFNGGPSAHCELSGWTTGQSTTTTVGVLCFNAAGAAADEYFDLSYNRSSLEDEGMLSGLYAYAYNPTRRNYTPHLYYTEIGGVYPTAQRFGVPLGQYSLTASNPGGHQPLPFVGMVSAVGTGGEYCEVEGYDEFSTSFDMNLVCYDSQERQTNVAYSGAMFFELP